MSHSTTPVPAAQTPSGVQTHVYQREVGQATQDSLSKIVAHIRAGSAVLDVGTGSGALGRYLQQAGGYTVDGVTYNAQEAALAQPHYRHLKTLDLEQESLVLAMGDNRYDVVVCADVLEHLRNAGEVLQAMAALLKPGGVVLVSLPNVTHLGVLLALMAGRFVRTKEGLLDATHVHFLDRVGLQNLVAAAGFEVVEQDAVMRNLLDTEFAALNYQALPLDVRRYVEALPDSSLYQFVWVLKPVSDQAAAPQAAVIEPPAVPLIEQVPHFRAQLFQDCGAGFSQEDCQDAFGTQTNALQVLTFKVPHGAETRAIRLDLADRPGQVEFVHLVALDAEGTIVWKWSGDWAADLVYHQTDWTGVRGWLGGRVVRLTGDDPWVQIPLTAGAWANVNRVELCISGPQPVGTSDFPGVDAAQIQTTLQQLSGQAAMRQSQLEQQLESARSVADFRQTDIDTLRKELQAMTGLADFRQSDIDTLRKELQAMTGLADFRQSDIDTLRRELQAMSDVAEQTASELNTSQMQNASLTTDLLLTQLNLAESKNQLTMVLQSSSWKLTKGLRWLGHKLKRTTVN